MQSLVHDLDYDGRDGPHDEGARADVQHDRPARILTSPRANEAQSTSSGSPVVEVSILWRRLDSLFRKLSGLGQIDR